MPVAPETRWTAWFGLPRTYPGLSPDVLLTFSYTRQASFFESEMVWLVESLYVVPSGLATSWIILSLSIGLRLRTRILLRKEVIQPQVPLRLPCYDFIPITNHTLGN